jgi:hypothetical protein
MVAVLLVLGACAPAPSSTPTTLEFSELKPVKDAQGELYLLGFMTLTGEAPIFHGVIDVRVYGEDETTILATGQSQFFCLLNPGDKLPISFRLSPQPVPAWASYKLSTRLYPLSFEGRSYSQLTVDEYSIEGQGVFRQMRGKISNTGKLTAKDICLWAVGYDKGDSLIAVGEVKSGMITELNSGQSILFEIMWFDGDVLQVDTWDFYIKAWSSE